MFQAVDREMSFFMVSDLGEGWLRMGCFSF